jgi:hypothetical protein
VGQAHDLGAAGDRHRVGIADCHDRRGNERRLSAIASEIAGRDVRVSRPGPVGRLFGWDIVEGSVRFDADGKPADETKTPKQSCAELDALAEGRREKGLAQYTGAYQEMAEPYRSGGCVDGGPLDLRPDDMRFP